MPFGLVNAPATFSRMMRKLLRGLKNLRNYLDDVLSHTAGWEDHPPSLRQFFERVRGANSALKPNMCYIRYTSLVFLGHELGQGSVSPNETLVVKNQGSTISYHEETTPIISGVGGLLSSFCASFCGYRSSLTDLTKKEHQINLIGLKSSSRLFRL